MLTQHKRHIFAVVWLPISILAWLYGYRLDLNARDSFTPDKLSLLARKPTIPLASRWSNDSVTIGDSPDNILYFMQVIIIEYYVIYTNIYSTSQLTYLLLLLSGVSIMYTNRLAIYTSVDTIR
jgi:hypothetical protein